MRPQHIPVMQSIENYDTVLAASEEADIEKLSHYITQLAQHRRSTPEAQRTILELQKQKEGIMHTLHEVLAAIERNDVADIARISAKFESEVHCKRYVLDYQNGTYFLIGNPSSPITFGQIITDCNWNILYDLPWNNVPKKDSKRYFLERAKSQLLALFNQQILIDEIANRDTDEKHRNSYQGIRMSQEMGSQETRGGLVAEKMLKQFLKRLSIDGLPFRIEEVSLHDDVAGKVDFILVCEHEGKQERVGVQFTMNIGKIEKKLSDMATSNGHESLHLDRKILVAFPLEFVKQKFKRWSKEQSPGGPLELFSLSVKEGLFMATMNRAFPKNTTLNREMWEGVQKMEKHTAKEERAPAPDPITNTKRKIFRSFNELLMQENPST